MTDLGVLVGQRIRALRSERNMTQSQLATGAETLRPLVARMEKGRHTPTLLVICDYAQALGVLPSEILCVLDELPQFQWIREVKEGEHGEDEAPAADCA